jgi:lipopolysaccharide/colanic/teichoic acid biosynthesis glycosyltransferase
MTPARRLFDILLASALVALLALPFGLLLAVLLVIEGRPLFHVSERMRGVGEPFRLVKLRSMRPDPGDQGVSGGDKRARITRTGHLLRATRLDEIPQLWNVLAGDMSLVGPRPPLRRYVEAFPDLYRQVLRDRPGITGFATLHFHAAEERILSACTTAEATDAAYVARCIPRKARLDLIYQRRRTLCTDMVLLGQTAGRVLLRPFRIR